MSTVHNIFSPPTTGNDTAEVARLSAAALLGDLPGVQVTVESVETKINLASVSGVPGTPGTIDAILCLRVGDSSPWRLIVEVKNRYSADALSAGFDQLERYRRSFVSNLPRSEAARVISLLVVPYLSREAITRCSARGIACADRVGNGRLRAGTLLVEREGRPDPRPPRDPSLRTLFSPRAERVLRVLLRSPVSEVWHTQTLADTAQVSAGEVAKVRQSLREREALVESGRFSGFRLAHPEELLRDWAAHFQARKSVGEVHRYHSLAPVGELIRAIEKRQFEDSWDCAQIGFTPKPDIVFSGLTAAEQYAWYTRTPRVTAYVLRQSLPQIEAHLELEPVTTGANVVLTIPYDAGVFLPPWGVPDAPRVSAVQTYLDLHRLGGRAEEAAAFLLEQVLRPHWKVG